MSEEVGRRDGPDAVLIGADPAAELAVFRTLLAHAPFGFAFLDRDLRYVHVNDFLAEANGVPAGAHIGRTIREVVPSIADNLEPRLTEVLRTGQPVLNLELQGALPSDPEARRSWLANYYPVRGVAGDILGVGTVVVDVTARRDALEALHQRTLQQQVVAELGQRALEGTQVGELLDEATDLVARTLDVDFSEILALESSGSELLLCSGVGWSDGMVGSARVSAGPDSQAGYALTHRLPVIVEDLEQELRFTGLELLRRHGVRSGVTVVIETSAGPWGVLAAHSRTPRVFSPDDISFLLTVAHVVGAAEERSLAEEVLRDAGERLEFLAEASTTLNESLDYDRTLAEIARLAVPRFADCAAVDLVEGSRMVRVAVACGDPRLEESLWDLARDYPDALAPLKEVARTGEPRLIAQVTDGALQRVAADERQLGMLRSLELCSFLSAPLISRGRAVGVVSWGVARGRRYGAEDVALLVQVAERAGMAIENARLYQERTEGERRFRRLAGTLQASLLPPHLPDIAGLEVAAAFRPTAKGLEVGGDFYDLFPVRGREWGIVIGDVCGKGPEAATLTGLARYTLRTAAMQHRRPSRAIAVLNQVVLSEGSSERFLTVICGRLRPTEEGLRLSYSNGGHPAPLVLRAGGKVEALALPGMLVGMFADADFADGGTLLDPGDAVLFYTDGLLDARGSEGPFGEGRLTAALESCAGMGAPALVATVERAMLAYAEGRVHDDVAMLALRVTQPPGRA